MAIGYKETMRVEEFTSQYIMNPFYKQFGVTPKVADYNTADGRSKQINDIDCEINGWKIQEKSGKVMNNTILLEVYNDILAQSDEGLYGWGVTSDANYHLFGYRGGPEKELYEGKVYVYTLDAEKEPEIAALFGVRSYPTVVFCPMEGGPRVSQGYREFDYWQEAIRAYFGIEK